MEFACDVPAFGFLRRHQPAGKHFEFVAVFLALGLGQSSLDALRHLLHGAMDGRAEAQQAILENIVRGAAFERINGQFFAQHSRDQ